jgi:hypothetical protein
MFDDYVISAVNERLYWSNEDGWVDFASCTIFGESELHLNKPAHKECTWVPLEVAGDRERILSVLDGDDFWGEDLDARDTWEAKIKALVNQGYETEWEE